MTTTTEGTKPRKPKLTDVVTPEQILNPAPRQFTFKGQSFDILPVPDSVLQTIIDQLSDCIGVILGAAERPNDAGGTTKLSGDTIAEFTASIGKRGYKDFLKFIPQIAEVLLPAATKIVASALTSTDLSMLGNENADFGTYRRRVRVSEDWVDDNLFRAQRLEALELIIEAEDIPAILLVFGRLAARDWATPTATS